MASEAGRAAPSNATFEALRPQLRASATSATMSTTITSIGHGATASDALAAANLPPRPTSSERRSGSPEPQDADATVPSRYPPLMPPPPERVRTAVGGGTAGLSQMMITRNQKAKP